MKIVAYARLTGSAKPVADQIARAEAWAQRHRHEVRRLIGQELRAGAEEYPPRADLLRACDGGHVEAIVVADVAALGPRLAQALGRLDRAGVRLMIAGDPSGAGGHDLDSSALNLAITVAKASLEAASEHKAQAPQRVCPARVQIDLDAVRAAQGQGYRLIDIAQELGVARSTLVERLRKDRQNAGR